MTDSKPDRPVFMPLDRAAEIQMTERNLPHWFQAGAATFVTFRTADSMPADVLLRWQRELELWLRQRELPSELAASMVVSRVSNHAALLARLDAAQQREFKRLSDRVFHRSLDECHGACPLGRPDIAAIVRDAILFYHEDKYDLDRFIVMPNHVHVIVQFRSERNSQTISQSWMRYTARKINAKLHTTGAFWQAEPFDHIIRSDRQFEYLQQYIVDNPKKAKLPQDAYLYWERPV